MTTPEPVWFTRPGWSTAHRLENWEQPKMTLCGCSAEDAVEAPLGLRHCGQCARRRR